MKSGKRVAIYARVSSAGQRDRDLSIPEQIRQVEEFCDKRGWTVVEIFKDAAKSGAETANRPGLQKLLKAACSKARPFDLILTRELSRFGRSDEDAALRTRLRAHGVAIDNITHPSGDMDAALTPGGEFMERIQSAVDIHARQLSTQQMIAGQKAKARKGGLPGAQATCYGYKQEWFSLNGGRPVRKPVVDSATAKVVREIFRRYIAGDSLKKLTRWLNETGIAAPRGIAWYEATVRKMLSNETYLGRLVYGRIKKTKHPRTRTPVNTKNDGEVIRVDDAFPAIVDQPTFDRVQVILNRNESTRPQGGHPGNTLRGIGKCAVCGWHLAHQRKTNGGKWYYMCGSLKTKGSRKADPACKGNLDAGYVDEVVGLFLKRVLTTKALELRGQIERYNTAATELTGLATTEALDIAISEQETMVANLATAIAKLGGSSALLKRLDEAESKLADLRTKRDAILAKVRVTPVDADSVLQARSGIREALRDGDIAQMRTILAAIVSEVRCDWSRRRNPAVNFNYLYEDLREPIQFHTSENEAQQWREAFPESFERSYAEALVSKSVDLHTDLRALRMPYKVSINVKDSPLTFVPKWSITGAERAAEEAIQQIVAALT